MELSTYDLPPHHEKQNIVIVESGEGNVGMLSPLDGGTSLEYYTLLQNGTDKSYKWHFKSTIPLPVHGTSKFLITGYAEGYIFLAHLIKEQDTTYSEFISLEVKSLNIERVCRTCGTFDAHPYFGFPPSMSPRRIQGYGGMLFSPLSLDFCGSHAFELLSCDCDAGIALCLWVHLSLRSLWSPHSALAIRQFGYVRYLQSVHSSMIFLVLVFFAVAKVKRS
jgi:hypothetical protein